MDETRRLVETHTRLIESHETDLEVVRSRLNTLENEMSKVVTGLKVAGISLGYDEVDQDTTPRKKPQYRKYQRDLDDELDGIPDVHGNGGDPEATMVFSRPVGLGEPPAEIDERPYPALDEAMRAETAVLEVGQPGWRDPVSGHVVLMDVRSKVDPFNILSRLDIPENDHISHWQQGHRAALDAAADRVRKYMSGHFSEGTIGGVVQAIYGHEAVPLGPFPVADETEKIRQFGAPWDDDRPQRTDQSTLTADEGPYWQAHR